MNDRDDSWPLPGRARLFGYATHFQVGDVRVIKNRAGAGWVIIRRKPSEEESYPGDGELVLVTNGQWFPYNDIDPQDPWVEFSDVVDALTAAELDYTRRTGLKLNPQAGRVARR